MKNTLLHFVPVNDDILSLSFGETSITLYREGKMIFKVGNTECTLLPESICLESSQAKIEIKDGKISLEGESISQSSQSNLIFKAQKAFQFE